MSMEEVTFLSLRLLESNDVFHVLQSRSSQLNFYLHLTPDYFSSMVDPSYGGEVEVLTDKQKKAAKAKGKKNKLGTG